MNHQQPCDGQISQFVCFLLYGGFLKWGYSQIIQFKMDFPLKPIYLGVPPFQETPIYVVRFHVWFETVKDRSFELAFSLSPCVAAAKLALSRNRKSPLVLLRFPCSSGWWFGCHFLFSHILGMSSSQLTFIFFRGVAQPPTSHSLLPLPEGQRFIDYNPLVLLGRKHWRGRLKILGTPWN